MPEGYVPGKIPVVLIHGLLSEPTTWDPLVEALQENPRIAEHYQFWRYGYPTGLPYLTTASRLRADLSAMVRRLDPAACDPNLQNVVLIGHSMGGLLSKLQVTDSGNRLWNALGAGPVADLKADPQQRADLERAYFFQPLPFVRRVVYIATPHGGSGWSRNWVGRFASGLVRFPKTMQTQYKQLVHANSDALVGMVSEELPTSVDLLSPDNPILKATAGLPFAPWVATHSIIGERPRLLNFEPGDDVVSVTHARVDGVESELVVPSTHIYIHEHRQTIEEIERILLLHLATSPGRVHVPASVMATR